MGETTASRPRAAGLGIRIGRLSPGPLDAITDVAGVRVGHATLVEGEGPLVLGRGPVRTGVTVIIPPGGGWRSPLYAGFHRLNGNGEMTGLHWIADAGLLTSPIALTNTHSIGSVHAALVELERDAAVASGMPHRLWSLPVVAETWDGLLNDIDGFHVRAEHVRHAFADASAGSVLEGNVGGGTGMICHGFKGGIGTASRMTTHPEGPFTVGVLVQANYGRRERLAVAGAPVGAEIGSEVVPLPGPLPADRGSSPAPGGGSIIVVAVTDAPLLPHQCARLAQRCALGIGRMGGAGEPSSGDLVLAFATGNRDVEPMGSSGSASATYGVLALRDDRLGELFWAAIEATEEAILNALLAAETMTGRDGITAHALPHDLLLASLEQHALR